MTLNDLHSVSLKHQHTGQLAIVIKDKATCSGLHKCAVVFACFLLDSRSQPADDLLVRMPAVTTRHHTTRAARAVCDTQHSTILFVR